MRAFTLLVLLVPAFVGGLPPRAVVFPTATDYPGATVLRPHPHPADDPKDLNNLKAINTGTLFYKNGAGHNSPHCVTLLLTYLFALSVRCGACPSFQLSGGLTRTFTFHRVRYLQYCERHYDRRIHGSHVLDHRLAGLVAAQVWIHHRLVRRRLR